MNKEIWRATVHGVSKSQTQLNELSQIHTFKNYMRYSTLHYKIGSALDDFAQLQAHVRIYSG